MLRESNSEYLFDVENVYTGLLLETVEPSQSHVDRLLEWPPDGRPGEEGFPAPADGCHASCYRQYLSLETRTLHLDSSYILHFYSAKYILFCCHLHSNNCTYLNYILTKGNYAEFNYDVC